MDWLYKGKSLETHGLCSKTMGFPVDFPVNQFWHMKHQPGQPLIQSSLLKACETVAFSQETKSQKWGILSSSLVRISEQQQGQKASIHLTGYWPRYYFA